MSGKILYTVTAGFSGGILVVSLLPELRILFISAALTSAGIFFLLSWQGKNHRRYFTILALCFFSIALGGLRVWLFTYTSESPLLDVYENNFVEARGVIIGEPDPREVTQRLIVRLHEIKTKEETVTLQEKVLVLAPLYPFFSYGDEIALSGKLSRPQNFETESGRLFDYQSYLAKDGIYFVVSKPKITLLSSGQGNSIKHFLFGVKRAFTNSISRTLPEPESSLLAGLLIGAKRSLPADLLEDFRRVGLIHIVVLSGYNLTIVGLFFMKIFDRLGRRARLVCGGISIALFALMVGFSATVVRAAVMSLLSILSKLTYRRYDVSRALAITGFLMLLHNPMILAFDPSFQLSFLATIGLVYVSPIVEQWVLKKVRGRFREIVVETLATQIFVTPYLLYLTGNFSAVALLSNLLVLPAVSLTMFFGFLAGTFGIIHTVLAFPFVALSFLLLHYILSVTTILSRLPFSSVSLGTFSWWFVMIMYAVILVVLYRNRKGTVDISPVSRNLELR